MRRGFAIVLALSLGMPGLAGAQSQTKPARIGFLAPGSGPGPLLDVFREGLRELGWVEGQNLTIENRFAEATERFPKLAEELVRLNPHAIVTIGTPGALAAKSTTSAIPIVMVAVGDPVESRLVASLARPGGNVTGLSLLTPELVGKRLELLKETVPVASRIAFVRNPANPRAPSVSNEVRKAARALGLALELVDIRPPIEMESAFSAMAREGVDALYVLSDPLTYVHRETIATLAARSRLPAIYDERGFAEAGGLMSYGVKYADLYRRAATFVDKILKGAKPADLPVEQPTKFELVINLKTAKALGLTIPPAVMIRADHVIQ